MLFIVTKYKRTSEYISVCDHSVVIVVLLLLYAGVSVEGMSCVLAVRRQERKKMEC